MGADFTFLHLTQTPYNENILMYYRQVKTDKEVITDKPDFDKMSIQQRISYLDKNFSNGITIDGKKVDIYEDDKIPFYGKDGESDAYVKRGLDIEEIEFLDNQFANGRAWRIETSDSYIDFRVGGQVIIDNTEWRIVKIIYALNTGTSQNRLWANPNTELMQRGATKTLILA